MGEIADALRRNDRSSKSATDPHRRSTASDSTYVPAKETSDVPPLPLPPPPAAPEINVAHERHRSPKSIQRDGTSPWRASQIAFADSSSDATQQYRRVAFRLRDRADARGARSIVITSAQPGDGKTTTSCNLALQLARLDQSSRIVLVDLDLRRASLAKAFGISVEVSVDAVLRGEENVHDAVCETDIPGLCMLALARPATDPEWLLAQPTLEAMIRDLEDEFDYVIIDTPPVLATSDAQVILRHASTCLFVVRAAVTPVKSVVRALEHLPTKKILGSLMNFSRASQTPSGYAYYGAPEADDDAEQLAEELEPTDGQ